MNKVGKAGTILIIIASAIMLIAGIYFLMIGTYVFGVFRWITGDFIGITWILIIIGIADFILAILNIIFASLSLANNKKFFILTGVFAMVSLLFGLSGFYISFFLLLIGGILVFCGRNKEVVQTQNNANIIENQGQ